MSTRRVGLVGVGAMGYPIARRLLAAGHEVRVFDVRPETMSAAVAAGAEAVSSVRSLADVQVAFLLVPTDEDVLSAGGCLVDLLEAQASAVVCSSVRPETCRVLAERARPRRIHVVDAALTGGVRAAEAGTISLLVGGETAVVDDLRPVFDAFCARITHLGEVGSGQVGKTVNNLLHWATIAAVAEALTLGERLGVPAPRMREALLGGPTDSRTLQELDQFRLTWWAKDLDNAVAIAAAADVELPLTERVRELLPGVTVAQLGDLTGKPCNGQTIRP